jgi:hypothetical protein
MENIAPFYVGQEVVAVRDHYNYFKKGQEFIVTGLRRCCKCNPWIISIGIPSIMPENGCRECNFRFPSECEIFFSASRFRAKTPAFEAITYSKVMEQETVSVN